MKSSSQSIQTYKARKSGKQVNVFNKINLVKKLIYTAQYKEELKKATANLKHNIEKKNLGDSHSTISSPILSIREIILKHNIDLPPNAPKLLTKSTVYRYVNKNIHCDSPLKMGPPANVPLPYEKLFALHIRMMQNSLGNFNYLIIFFILHD